MKEKSRIEIERKIVSRIKREMDQPRLAESVRNGLRARSALAVEKPALRSSFCTSVNPSPVPPKPVTARVARTGSVFSATHSR
jgi:hypothetical protein